MRAVGHRQNLPVDDPDSLVEVDLPTPDPEPHDLLVRVRAASVNPVDVHVRVSRPPEGDLRVLGYDAAGTVEAVGADVTRFAPGDEVWYAGSIARQGSDAEYQVVDERVVGHKPRSLGFAAAAAMPLTTITAWEGLFDRLRLGPDDTGTMVVVGAAGGVGSMVTQLARARTKLTVVGTASRPESRDWALAHGAHAVVDRHGDLAAAVEEQAPDGVDFVFSPFTPKNAEAYAKMLRTGGHVAAIDDAPDVNVFKSKAIAFHWELMFARPLWTPDDDYQHRLLDEAARLVDAGVLRTTMTAELHGLDATTLREAHRRVETSSTIGKVVVSFD